MVDIVGNTPPPPPTGATSSGEVPTTGLGDRKLGMIDVVAQALGSVGPVFGALTFLPLIAGVAGGNGAGGAIPLAVLLAAVAVFGVAWTMSRFARRVQTTGSLYDYIACSFGDRVGTAFGSLYFVGMIAGLATTPLIFGGYLSDFLASRLGTNVDWWVISLVFIALLAVVLALGVSISTRAQLLLTLLSMVAVIAFSVYVIGRGLGDGIDGTPVSASAPFDVSTSPSGWLASAGVCSTGCSSSPASRARPTSPRRRRTRSGRSPGRC